LGQPCEFYLQVRHSKAGFSQQFRQNVIPQQAGGAATVALSGQAARTLSCSEV
jgi:hypothetical protein